MIAPWLHLLTLAVVAPHPGPGDAPLAQFVRIEIHGEGRTLKKEATDKDGNITPAVVEGRILSLAEVEVFSNKQNVALNGTATQSTTYQNFGAQLAIDGVIDGAHAGGSVTHTSTTAEDGSPPLQAWWEVDLGAPLSIDQVTIWNRTDGVQSRLAGYALILLDENRQEVGRITPNPAPPIYRDHLFKGVEPRRSNASLAREHALQAKINVAIDSGVEWLKLNQNRDGCWQEFQPKYRNGLTALSAYALVKSGVKKDSHYIQRAVNWLKQVPCDEMTYSTGCTLMLLAALDDEEHLEWAEELTDFLVQTQGGGGSMGLWAYPGSSWDLSNSQYAALGLRAADQLGVRIPKKTWQLLIDDTLSRQVEAQAIDPPPGMEGRSSTGYRLAPFCYRDPDTNGGTGSMTTAGIGILAIGIQGLGGRTKYAPMVKRANNYALNWLAINFDVSRSPGGGKHRYYLYGLERVGALLEIDRIGPYDWYEAGATNLTGSQGGNGAWSNSPVETCYALLFLSRATASSAVSGRGGKGPKQKLTYTAENKDSEIWLRGSGAETLTIWLSGFPDWVLKEFTPADDFVPDIARGLRLVSIEYSINNEVVARIPGDPTRAWRGERYPYRHTFKTRGDNEITACAYVLGPKAMPGDADGTVKIQSDSFNVPVEGLKEEWMLPASEAGARNLLNTIDVMAMVSSDSNRGKHADKEAEDLARALEGAKVVDGHEFTHWLCAPDDEKPTLTVNLARPVRARRLLLSPAGSSVPQAKSFDRIVKARVILNGEDKKAFEILFPKDTLQKAVIEFRKTERIRSFRVEILERVKQDKNHGMAGFSEVSLER
jgi:hypothetical protein